MLGIDDLGDAQIDLTEFVDGDGLGNRCDGMLLSFGVAGLRVGVCCRSKGFFVGFYHGVYLFLVNAGH